MSQQHQQKSSSVVLEQPAPSLLDEVVAQTKPNQREIPKGWELLPAGIVRQIKVNVSALWISPFNDYKNDPYVYIIIANGEEKLYKGLEILGKSKMVCKKLKHHGCGPGKSVFIETTAELLVQP